MPEAKIANTDGKDQKLSFATTKNEEKQHKKHRFLKSEFNNQTLHKPQVESSVMMVNVCKNTVFSRSGAIYAHLTKTTKLS